MAQNAHAYSPDPPIYTRGQAAGGSGAALIKVRGTRDGLLLSVPDDPRLQGTRDVAAALAAHLDTAEAFFNGADVIVDLGERAIDEEEISYYRTILEQRGVVVRGFTASSPHGRATIRKAGYHPLQIAQPERIGALAAPQPQTPAGQPGHEMSEALYLRRTLRSGARVRHHGNIVLIGDINAGAEVAASGDIIVWGTIRGLVHAGALGDDNAMICALSLTPTQLRIGSHYALPPADKRQTSPGTPERVRLDNGRLVVEPWKNKDR